MSAPSYTPLRHVCASHRVNATPLTSPLSLSLSFFLFPPLRTLLRQEKEETVFHEKETGWISFGESWKLQRDDSSHTFGEYRRRKREGYGILNVIIQRTIPRSSFSGLEAELRSKTFDSAEVSPRN